MHDKGGVLSPGEGYLRWMAQKPFFLTVNAPSLWNTDGFKKVLRWWFITCSVKTLCLQQLVVNTLITHAQQLKDLFIQYFVSLVMIILQMEKHLICYLQRGWKTIVAWFEWNAVFKCIWRALDGASNKPVALTTHLVELFHKIMFCTFRSINTRTHSIQLIYNTIIHLRYT